MKPESDVSTRRPDWIDEASMYAGAYLVVRAVEDFLEGVDYVFDADANPDDMEQWVKGVREAVGSARWELAAIGKQTTLARRIDAEVAMEHLIEYRKSLKDGKGQEQQP